METKELKGKKLLEKGQNKSSARSIIKIKENGDAVRIYFSNFDGVILTLKDIEDIENGTHDKYEFLFEEEIKPTNGQSFDSAQDDSGERSRTITLSLNKTKEVEILSDAKKRIEKLKGEEFGIEDINKYLEEKYPNESAFEIANIVELAFSLIDLEVNIDID